jgi:hypothetical protein
MKRGAAQTNNRGESGFAMLLVFVMAAAIAITLYVEVPRMAFESQRAKEQMAIDRGLQYQRAIQLFYRKYHLYPQTLDDLETARNVRFLRRRYLDPLTGKDWRLLHVGPAGQLTDSLVQPPAPLPGSSTGSGPNSFGSSSQAGSSTTQPQPGNASSAADPNAPPAPPNPLNMAARRPSDRIIGAGGPGAGAPGGNAENNEPPPEQPPEPEPDPNQAQQPADPNAPQQAEPQNAEAQNQEQPPPPEEPAAPQELAQPGEQTGGQPVGQPVGQPGGQPGQPAQTPVQFPPGFAPQPGTTPGQTAPGQSPNQPYAFGNPAGNPSGNPSNNPSVNPSVNPGQSPSPFSPNPGFQPGQQAAGQPVPAAGAPGQQQSAANVIQNLLTTPRQPPSSAGGFTSGNTGGIAGVASTAEGKGIHVVNDHDKYKEWEFVYDLKKDKTVMGAAAVNAQQNVQQQMQQNQNGAGPLGNNSSFGSNSGGSSPFSSTPTSSPNPSTPAGSTAPTTPPPQ